MLTSFFSLIDNFQHLAKTYYQQDFKWKASVKVDDGARTVTAAVGWPRVQVLQRSAKGADWQVLKVRLCAEIVCLISPINSHYPFTVLRRRHSRHCLPSRQRRISSVGRKTVVVSRSTRRTQVSRWRAAVFQCGLTPPLEACVPHRSRGKPSPPRAPSSGAVCSSPLCWCCPSP